MGYRKAIFYGFRSQFMDWIFDFSAVVPKENKKVESLLSKVTSFVNFMPNWQNCGNINHLRTFKLTINYMLFHIKAIILIITQLQKTLQITKKS